MLSTLYRCSQLSSVNHAPGRLRKPSLTGCVFTYTTEDRILSTTSDPGLCSRRLGWKLERHIQVAPNSSWHPVCSIEHSSASNWVSCFQPINSNKQQDVIAEGTDGVDVVAHQKNGPAFAAELLDPVDDFNENHAPPTASASSMIRIGVDGISHRKSKAGLHPV
jgi:hypothetical protein